MRVGPDDFGRALDGLDTDEFVRFVADVWNCRGYDVVVRDDVVSATDPTTGRRERIGVARRSLGRWRVPTTDLDVVVVRTDGDPGRHLTRPDAARFVDTESLAEMACYALSGADRRRLFDRHFDRPPAAPHSPAVVDRLTASVDTGAVAVLALLLVSVASFGVAVPDIVGVGTDAADAGTTRTPTATERATTTPSTPGPASFPPGVDEYGVADTTRLGTAHAQALENTSYRFVRITRISPSSGTFEREGYRRVTVADTLRFRTESDGNLPMSEGGFGSVHAEVYADGSDVYRQVRRGNESVYLTGPMVRADRFQNQAEWFITVYLSASESDVSRGPNGYVVTASGTPERLDGVSNYSAVAAVDSEGFVRSLNVSYDQPDDGATRRVNLVFEYSDVGDVTVTPPPWYPTARNATD